MSNLQKLITDFKLALKNQSSDIIKSMWKNNPQLLFYYRGNTIQVTNEQGQIETVKLAPTELIPHFKLALASQCPIVIKSIWENENSPLQSEIKKLDDTKLTELTERVLYSSPIGKSAFITTFLNSISNKQILETCLNKRAIKKPSFDEKNQVTSLNNRLEFIEAVSALLSISHPIQSCSSNAENEQTALIDNPATRPYSTPLHNNSVFNKNNNKRPCQDAPTQVKQNKFQKN